MYMAAIHIMNFNPKNLQSVQNDINNFSISRLYFHIFNMYKNNVKLIPKNPFKNRLKYNKWRILINRTSIDHNLNR